VKLSGFCGGTQSELLQNISLKIRLFEKANFLYFNTSKQYATILYIFCTLKKHFWYFFYTVVFISLTPLKKSKAYIHRGHILKDAVEATRFKKGDIAAKAGYTRSSYYKHILDAELPYHILAAYGKALKIDFTDELPEMPKYLIEEKDTLYTKGMTIEDLLKQVEYWKDKYIELLEKYNRLIEEKRGK